MATVLEDLARGIDVAFEAQDAPALRGYLESIALLGRADVSKVDRGSLAFFEANIHAALRIHADSTSADWLEPLLEAEIRALRVARLALADESTRTLRNDLKLRVITNLANAVNRSGRFVEAIELWDEVLAEHPRYGMAMGNKALALYGYARYAGTGIERALLLRASYRTVKAALEAGVESHATAQISDLAAHISSVADWEKAEVPLPLFDAGRSKRERQYRRWCVRHRVVLSLINDVEFSVEAFQDAVTLPSIAIAAGEARDLMPRPYAIFNQLKQEYVSARYLVFEALCERDDKLHFSDRGVVFFMLWTIDTTEPGSKN
jgi:tetratricopeptide (TPR) repeat protein